ncbi:tyrosine-type recombinase/integrase [Limnofasciculus baicalensis]|uniref:Site-specific integrase n=1 Tax=Limnofasciculus baicalensis BBK-W-15 TaxID=2699891 RepID=A0AAE3GV49_9CYAN|nr:tyrosine-type recombinase/integrase [Limnofasciculus baicalensis]MCP2731230.1 site-specific integrase [Limnofasciculus baicalensis BBK-W-15]
MVAPKRPSDNHGSIRIRFTHNGIRFTLGSLGQYGDSIALKHAQTICDRIALDIASGNFTATNNGELALKYNPSAIGDFIKQAKKGIQDSIKDLPTEKEPTLIELLEKRLENKFSTPDKAVIVLLKKYHREIESIDDAQNFITWLKTERGVSNSTIQRYQNTLKVVSPFFRQVKIEIESKPLPKPFTAEETREIIDWFQVSEYYCHYADYVKFLFLTGTRTSEAIGLQWKHIDFNRNLLFIYESLGRNKNNTSHRVRKTTKTNKMREFPIAHGLLEMLTTRYEQSDKNPESLVFPSPKGHPIDDHNFSQRIWAKCLKELGIEHRPQYNTRHTFISHFLEKTKDVVKCASLTHGSKSGIQTIYNNYAGIINRVEVPELF